MLSAQSSEATRVYGCRGRSSWRSRIYRSLLGMLRNWGSALRG